MAVQTPPKPRIAQQRVQWQPPSPDWLNINFDGALFTAENKFGIGVLI